MNIKTITFKINKLPKIDMAGGKEAQKIGTKLSRLKSGRQDNVAPFPNGLTE